MDNAMPQKTESEAQTLLSNERRRFCIQAVDLKFVWSRTGTH